MFRHWSQLVPNMSADIGEDIKHHFIIMTIPLPHLHTPFLPFFPSLISLVVSVDVKHHVYLLTISVKRAQNIHAFQTLLDK